MMSRLLTLSSRATRAHRLRLLSFPLNRCRADVLVRLLSRLAFACRPPTCRRWRLLLLLCGRRRRRRWKLLLLLLIRRMLLLLLPSPKMLLLLLRTGRRIVLLLLLAIIAVGLHDARALLICRGNIHRGIRDAESKESRVSEGSTDSGLGEWAAGDRGLGEARAAPSRKHRGVRREEGSKTQRGQTRRPGGLWSLRGGGRVAVLSSREAPFSTGFLRYEG